MFGSLWIFFGGFQGHLLPAFFLAPSPPPMTIRFLQYLQSMAISGAYMGGTCNIYGQCKGKVRNTPTKSGSTWHGASSLGT